jgi:hypothetical protein
MIWTFGDSFSTTWEKMYGLGVKYIEYKGYQPKIFSNYLSTMLGVNVNQFGIGGVDNNTIFDCIIDNIESITTNDIVIVGWTEPSRFRLEKNNKWTTIQNYDSTLESYKFIDTNALQQILVNRMSRLYWDEIVNWSKLLSTIFELKGIKVIFWSPFALCTDIHLKKQLLPKNWYIGTLLNRLQDETNGVINDAHFSEIGHKELADIFYKKLN